MIDHDTLTGRHSFRPRFLKTLFSGPFVFSDSGWQWWLHGSEAEAAARLMDSQQQGTSPARLVMLRDHKGRRAFRLDLEPMPCFAKEVTMTSLRTRLGALLGRSNVLLRYDHGTAETRHNLFLDSHTSSGVRTLALGEHVRHGLPDRQILIHEYLSGWQPLGEVWRATDRDDDRQQLAARLEDLLGELYSHRICHLDLNAGHIMVPEDRSLPMRVIDCGRMCTSVRNPLIATALHVGKLMRDLGAPEIPERHAQARNMLRRIAGAAADAPRAQQVLLLACRYRISKRLNKRRLIMNASQKAIDLATFEARLLTDPRNRPPAPSALQGALPGPGAEKFEQACPIE
ncbi:lipopolysaccharide kinase (Kdo/WaaP) family protein [Kushneria sinocarnis]|uniref:Lipopolysaccharide kinase (Kdo/WaaP) family protein n=1 Tax=Kushneria sinocarnis TaxID=595502 RepID=A0A420WSX1_9GAMM|nr:lipopolysaccharide kinase InaA family protein [Kushneria sinocarnis]RKQ95866.1 lipopolysaccharide kinase (Kdo/WaaP) family protein [Kushneria sinocarnis]